MTKRTRIPGILMLSALLLLTVAGIAGARTMTQPVVSVVVTDDGVVENGLVFFEYDGGPFTLLEVDGVRAVRLDERSSSSRYLYLKVDNDVIFGGPFDAEITFMFLVPQMGSFRLLYDSLTTGDRYTDSGYVTIGPDKVNKWVTHTFELTNIQFADRAASGQADMRLHTTGHLPMYVRAVEIKVIER